MLIKIATLNLSLLIAHQIDAAYWHEWDLFGLPGGIQLFNFLNVLIFGVLLAFFVELCRMSRAGFAGSLVVAGASSLVLPIHSGFALAGHPEFHLPFSIFLIVSTFAVSLVQVVLTFRYRTVRAGRHAMRGGPP